MGSLINYAQNGKIILKKVKDSILKNKKGGKGQVT